MLRPSWSVVCLCIVVSMYAYIQHATAELVCRMFVHCCWHVCIFTCIQMDSRRFVSISLYVYVYIYVVHNAKA
jgi:hypothetical protein